MADTTEDKDSGDNPLTYKERCKEECTKALGMCFWNKVVESFKAKSKRDEKGIATTEHGRSK